MRRSVISINICARISFVYRNMEAFINTRPTKIVKSCDRISSESRKVLWKHSHKMLLFLFLIFNFPRKALPKWKQMKSSLSIFVRWTKICDLTESPTHFYYKVYSTECLIGDQWHLLKGNCANISSKLTMHIFKHIEGARVLSVYKVIHNRMCLASST